MSQRNVCIAMHKNPMRTWHTPKTLNSLGILKYFARDVIFILQDRWSQENLDI